jgi:hypothetical protein
MITLKSTPTPPSSEPQSEPPNPDELAAECRAKLEAMDPNQVPPVYAKNPVSFRMALKSAIAAFDLGPGQGRSVVNSALRQGWTVEQLFCIGGPFFPDPKQMHGSEALNCTADLITFARGTYNKSQVRAGARLIWELGVQQGDEQ